MGAGGNSPFLEVDDFINLSDLVLKLTTHRDPLSDFLWGQLSAQEKLVLLNTDSTLELLAEALRDGLNRVLKRAWIYDRQRFSGIALSEESEKLLSKKRLSKRKKIHLNRMLLQEAYPLEIAKWTYDPFPVLGCLLFLLVVIALVVCITIVARHLYRLTLAR